MPLLPFGEWIPDTTDYESKTSHTIQNVIPRGDGYGPFPDFAAATSALPAVCRGAFYALKSDGTVQVFAGTSLGLYKLDNTALDWINVGRISSCTITNASPGVVSMTNSFVANEPVQFAAGAGTLPSQLVAGTTYYVLASGLSGSSFKVAAIPGGAAINTSGGSGTVKCSDHYSALSSNAQWQFAQTGSLVWATQANEPLQVFNLASDTDFSNSLGSPPQAAYISVVGRFLVLSGLLSQPYRVQWSGLNSFNVSTSWDNVTAGSNYQDFPDGGIVRGVAGGEFGTIFQDQAMRRMSYIPGSAIIFQIERISDQVGLFAPYSIVRAGSTIYFYSNRGFQKIDPGGFPQAIGREKIDRTFLADLDKTSLQMFMGASDPRSTRVYWAYKSGAGSAGTYDKILGYDEALDRFFPVSINGEYLLGISQTGLTLENLDSISSSIDALTLTLDAYATAVQPEVAQFDTNHKQGFFRGNNLEATLETAEQGTDGTRIMVEGFRPITDAATLYGSVSSRETQGVNPTAGAEVAINSRTGNCDLRASTRYARFKVRVPVATNWTFCAGVEPDISPDGEV